MKRRGIIRITALLSMTLVQGCLVWRYTELPKVSGVVIDAGNKQPVGGAKVGFRQHEDKAQITDRHGRFCLPPKHEWRFCPLIPGDYWPRGSLFVEAPGYQVSEQWVGVFGEQPAILKEPIRLKSR